MNKLRLSLSLVFVFLFFVLVTGCATPRKTSHFSEYKKHKAAGDYAAALNAIRQEVAAPTVSHPWYLANTCILVIYTIVNYVDSEGMKTGLDQEAHRYYQMGLQYARDCARIDDAKICAKWEERLHRAMASWNKRKVASTARSYNKAPQSAGKIRHTPWFNEAKDAYFRKDYDLVIDLCNSVLKHNPKEAVAYHFRGLAFSGKSLVDKAIAEYTAAIGVDDPKGVEYHKWMSYYNRGLCYARKVEYRKAIADYNMAVKLIKKYPDTYHFRGQAFEKLGLLSEALADARKALLLSPDNPKYRSRVDHLEAKLAEQHAALPRPASDKLISLEICNIEVRPGRVSPGAKFDLILEYSVTDTRVDEDRIPVKFEYSILDRTKVLFKSRLVEIMGLNGKRTSRIVHLTAAKKKGNYNIQALLKYKNKTVCEATEFEIE